MIFTTIWAKMASVIPATVDVVMKHWQKFVIILMVAVIYNQNFMELQIFKIIGVETVPHLKQDLERKQNEINEQKIDFLRLQADYNELDSLLIKMNAEVDKWTTTSQSLQEKHNNLLAELEELKKQSDQQVTEVLAEPTPDTCDEAIDYLKEAVKDLK